MLLLKAKYLEKKTLPAKGDFPPSVLISLLDGTETLHLIGREDVLNEQLADTQQFADVVVELRSRRIDLASIGEGGKGKAYRLSVVGVVTDLKEVLAA
jgi:hypothetical protein